MRQVCKIQAEDNLIREIGVFTYSLSEERCPVLPLFSGSVVPQIKGRGQKGEPFSLLILAKAEGSGLILSIDLTVGNSSSRMCDINVRHPSTSDPLFYIAMPYFSKPALQDNQGPSLGSSPWGGLAGLGPSALALSLLAVSLAAPALANPNPIRQLLSEKVCNQCQLERAGLVFAQLGGAKLEGANLRGANLSRANLQEADLRGANLQGTALYGANLQGADLTGADLRGADLRGAYLGEAKFDQALLENAHLRGAIAIPPSLVTADTYYAWAVSAAHQGRHPEAVEHYTHAVEREPERAIAYLGRGLSISMMGNIRTAVQDLETAKSLFQAQQNLEGVEMAEVSITALTTEIEYTGDGSDGNNSVNRSRQGGGNFLGQLFRSIGPLLMRAVPFLL